MPRWSTAPRLSPGAPYATASARPLHILVFLLPLMVLYELGSVFYLAGAARGADTIGARGILAAFFRTFGAASLHLPPIALGVVLLAWHILLSDPWRVRAKVLAGMWLESAMWALPLLVFSLVISRGNANPAFAGEVHLSDFPWQARLTISLGAGIYEELLFRLVLITLLHFVFVDLLRVPERAALIAAAIVSATAFAAYHNITGQDGRIDLHLAIFFWVAGLYFAALFITRGFGIAVATHALYDMVALLVFSQDR